MPETRKNLPSSNVLVSSGFWNYECTADFEPCTESECCANPSFGCYKRAGRPFAMCRPLQPSCVDHVWICPGWEKCGNAFDECTHSACCRDAKSECRRRPSTHYAQCRRASEPCTDWEQFTRDARSSSSELSPSWLCRGWEECSEPYGECTLSRCCSDPAFSCFLNATAHAQGRSYAECRPRTQQQPQSSRNTTSHSLPTPRGAPAVSPTLSNGGTSDTGTSGPGTVPGHAAAGPAVPSRSPATASAESWGVQPTHEPVLGAATAATAGSVVPQQQPQQQPHEHEQAHEQQPAATAGASAGAPPSQQSKGTLEGATSEQEQVQCDESGEWLCPEQWMTWRDELFASPITTLKKHLDSGTIALIVIGCTLATCCVLGCTYCHRRRMQRGVKRLEEQIASRRIAHEIELARRGAAGGGEGEGVSLRGFALIE